MLTGFVKQHIVSANCQSTRDTPSFSGGLIVARFYAYLVCKTLYSLGHNRSTRETPPFAGELTVACFYVLSWL